MFSSADKISDFDPVLFGAIQDEERRQEEHIELICLRKLRESTCNGSSGGVLTNNMPRVIHSDVIMVAVNMWMLKQLAIERAKELFGADYANVQPHSGLQANAEVYMALLQTA